MISQRDRDETNRLIESYREKARKIRSLTSDEDIERYRKQLARKNRADRTWTVGGTVVLAIIGAFLGVLDVITDQILHACISAVVVGILIVNTWLTYRLPKGSFATVHLLTALALIVESVRLSLRESWWSVAALLLAAAFILHASYQSKKLAKKFNERK